MSGHEFEVAVIGGTTGALVTAGLLAKRGLRTILIDQDELSRPTQPFGEDLWCPPKDDPIAKVHAELGIYQPKRTERTYQVIFGERRLEVQGPQDALLNEIRRAFGSSEKARFHDFVSKLSAEEQRASAFFGSLDLYPNEGFFKRKKIDALAKKHSALFGPPSTSSAFSALPEELRDLLLSVHLAFSGLQATNALATLSPLIPLARGFEPTEETARQALKAAIQDRGVDLRSTKSARIEPGHKGVRISTQTGDVVAETLVDATHDLAGLSAIPARLRSKSIAMVLQDAVPRARFICFSVEVDREVLPPSLGDVALLAEPRAAPAILVKEDATSALAQLSLFVLMESGAMDAGEGALEAVKPRLEALIPFLPEGTPTFKRRPMALEHDVFDPEVDRSFGVCGVSSVMPEKHIYLAGPCVFPGLGAQGRYLAALQVADAITRTKR